MGVALTGWRFEVLVPSGQRREGPGTDIALVARAVPGSRGRFE